MAQAAALPRAAQALAWQPGCRRARLSHRPRPLSDGGGGRGDCVRGARLGSLQLAGATQGRGDPGVGAGARPCHLSPARAVPRRADAVAAASHAPRRSRHRRDDRRALPSDRDRALHSDQVRRGGGNRRAGAGRAGLRGPAQRHLDVQSLECAHARARRRPGALAGGDARHAPRPPLHHSGRDRQQLRLQFPVVGPAVRHLSGRARAGPPGHDHRHRDVPRSRRAAARPHAHAAVPRRAAGV